MKKIQSDDAIGSSTMQVFFRPAGKPGFPGRRKGPGAKKRQKPFGKKKKKGAALCAAEDVAVLVPAKSVKAALGVQPAVRPVAKRPKLARIQWSLPENAPLMQEYVEDWLQKKGNYEEGMNMAEYCATIPGLKKGTFAQYANQRGKAIVVGSKPGRPRLFSAEDEQIIVDVTVRADRGQHGKTSAKIVDTLRELRPDVSMKQAENAFGRTIHPNHRDQLSGKVKAQATTTKRSAITVEQQYR